MNGQVDISKPTNKSGLVRVVSPGELNKQDENRDNNARAEETLSPFVQHLKKEWEEAKRAKRDVEARMLKGLRARRRKYDEQKLSAIRSVNSTEIYMGITAQKCRDAKSWILDILQTPGDKPWSIDPTPVPDLPESMVVKVREEVQNTVFQALQVYMTQMQGDLPSPDEYNAVANEYATEMEEMVKEGLEKKAKDAAEKMSLKIQDQLTEGKWAKVFKNMVHNVVDYPAGFLKSPIIKRKKTRKWTENEAGEWVQEVKEKIVVEFSSPSPFNIYPCNDTTEINNGPLFERHRLSRKELSELIGVPGYKDEAIRKVLDEHRTGLLNEWLWTDAELATLLEKPDFIYRATQLIDALEFWGSIQGSMLLEWGMSSEEIQDPQREYDVTVWWIGSDVIKATINHDKLGEKPYYKTSFEEVADSFWGNGVPDLIHDVQDVCNATARALVNNLSIASGPQVEVNTDRIAPGTNQDAIWPWKIWYSNSDVMKTTDAPAVRFYTPPMLSGQLMEVYNDFKTKADDQSGIPAYGGHGAQPPGGAGKTAAGLSMLMTSAARGIKNVVSNIDIDIIEPQIRSLYNFNMMFDPDESIKGDSQVKASGATSLIAKEQLMLRRTELLRETNNPIDFSIMGAEGRAELLREVVKASEIDVDKVVPDESKAPMSPQQAGGPNPASPPAKGGKGQEVDAAGNPVNGQDTALFRR